MTFGSLKRIHPTISGLIRPAGHQYHDQHRRDKLAYLGQVEYRDVDVPQVLKYICEQEAAQDKEHLYAQIASAEYAGHEVEQEDGCEREDPEHVQSRQVFYILHDENIPS